MANPSSSDKHRFETRINAVMGTLLKDNLKTLCVTGPDNLNFDPAVIRFAAGLKETLNATVLVIENNVGADALFDAIPEKSITPGEGNNPDRMSVNIGSAPAGMLEQVEALRQLFDALKKRYRFVIWSGWTVHEGAGLSVLAELFDGVILMIEGESTRRETALAFVNSLRETGVNIIGALFNKRKYYIPEWLYKRL